ncbi:hypothetical protein [Halohasta salina]|uniref:hypothetical protein n=1 Tax=Halohasta salina TaxID=2961621 RepID=UPI0020A60FD5|nr:hypothetical protein [Halohasta salina]
MSSHTRRQFLAVTAVATGGVAGCLGSESSTSRSGSATEGPGRTIPEQAATDPAVLFRRADADRPPIRLADDGDEADSSRRPDDHRPSTKVVDDTATADRLVVDESVDSHREAPSSDLASFRSSTDFERETLYLETKQVRQCFRLSLCYIAWDTGIETDYGRLLRPYDEQCTADRRVFESRLIRLPVALDADEINRFGSSTSSSACRPRQPQAEENRTNRSNGSEQP